MNVVDQIKSAVEASAKVVWIVFSICLAILLVDYFNTDLFHGLWEWFLPAVRVAAISTFVLCVVTIIPPIVRFIAFLCFQMARPVKKMLLRRKLMGLELFEVALLSRSLAESDRTVWANPDTAPVISLQDKGIIKTFFSGVARGDGRRSFEVPLDVWRVLLSLEEFRIHDPRGLIRVLDYPEHVTQSQFLSLLPSLHPAVQRARAGQKM